MEISIDGYKCWQLDGHFHRLDGPAIEYINGEKSWWLNGKYHRVDGPAVDFTDLKQWYLNGFQYTEEDYWEQLK